MSRVSSAYDVQARAEVRFYLAPAHTFDPWLSFGFGWEVLHVDLGTGSETASATYDGPVLGDVQFGIDVRARAFAIGPFFGLTLAEFEHRSLDPSPAGETASIVGRSVHEWFLLGLRGSYGPW